MPCHPLCGLDTTEPRPHRAWRTPTTICPTRTTTSTAAPIRMSTTTSAAPPHPQPTPPYVRARLRVSTALFARLAVCPVAHVTRHVAFTPRGPTHVRCLPPYSQVYEECAEGGANSGEVVYATGDGATPTAASVPGGEITCLILPPTSLQMPIAPPTHRRSTASPRMFSSSNRGVSAY